jgi:hypothetical protein
MSNFIIVVYCTLGQIYKKQYAAPMLKVSYETLTAILPHYIDTVYFGAFEDHMFGPMYG